MTEQVYVCGDDAPAQIILAAISTFVKDDEFQAKFANSGPTKTVALLVDGHEVPVVETLADIWRRMNDVVDQRARKMAVEMVTAAGLKPLSNALQEAEQKIRAQLGIWED